MKELVTNLLNKYTFKELEKGFSLKEAVSNVAGYLDKRFQSIQIKKIAWYVNEALIQKYEDKTLWEVDWWFSSVGPNDTIFEYDKKLCYLLEKDK